MEYFSSTSCYWWYENIKKIEITSFISYGNNILSHMIIYEFK